METQMEACPAPTRSEKRRVNWLEQLIEKTIIVSGSLTIVVVILLFVFLLREALPILKTHGVREILLGKDWYPLSDVYGFLPLIYGSLLVTAGAIIIALPVGVAAAIYIGEIAHPKVREILKPTVEVLAAIPSVVIGFLGIMLLAPWIQQVFNLPIGLTALAGSIMLAFMAMPTIISISEDALNAVPKEYRAGSLALGANDWQTISRVVVPAARSGILAGVMLGVGRAIGETMTVLMVTGNAALLPDGIAGVLPSFLRSVRTMTAAIVAEMGDTGPGEPWYHALFAVGAVLFIMTFLINLTADLALQRNRR